MNTKHLPKELRVKIAVVSGLAALQCIVKPNRIHTFRQNRNDYIVEMTAIDATTKILQNKMENGEIPTNMTESQLSPIWEAELAKQRIIAKNL